MSSSFSGRLRAAHAALVIAGVWGAGTVAHVQPQPATAIPKADPFSPLEFEDLKQTEEAIPGTPGTLPVIFAASNKYWVFQGLAYGASSTPVGSAWTSLGPLTTLADPASGSGQNISGRVSALAVSPTCRLDGPCRMWVGAADGGVWRTDNGMATDDPQWRWIGQGLGTNSIGSLLIDPNDSSGDTIYVGTGETNSSQNSGAGNGLYRSTDGGDDWTRVSTTILDPVVSSSPIDFTSTRGIASVAVEPGNPRVVYVATTTAILGQTAVRGGQSEITGYPQPRVGLYKTEDGGNTWTLIWVPPLNPVVPPNPNEALGASDTMSGVRLVKLDPRNPQIVYATAFNNAIHRSAPTLEGGDASFKPIYAIVGLQRFQDLAMFDLTTFRGHTRVYVYNGTLAQGTQSVYRLDNADVPASQLVTGTGANVVNTNVWTTLSSPDPSQAGSISADLCGAQCFYDLVVAVPPDQPDTVVIGGELNGFGEGTIRSTDAGATFHAFSSDAETPRSVAHVDVRAVVFHPANSNIAFVGSDGGVVRNDGTFTSIADRCQALYGNATQCPTLLASVPSKLYFMNRGLATLQFYNVSVDPHAPLQRVMGGVQDNGTLWMDGSGAPGVWTGVFPVGDGTSASGFHPSRPGVLFASYESNNFFVNFANGDLSRWLQISDPIQIANERATITASTGRQFMSFDQVNPDTQFTGFQHVWRTTDNGGSQAALEAGCNINHRFPSATCGDWVPLGVPYPFQAGTTASSASRKPGDLTSDAYGADRAGGIIVSAERSPADSGTLWAATSFGRVFIAKNADAPAPNVTFVRIDTPIVPNRFVTRIAPDPGDPNAAYISYTGFNALTPAAPGHVFRVVYDPSTRLATFASMDHDLGDLPINTLAFDSQTGDLYAGTDYGPLVLRKGSSSWTLAGIGFPQSLMVDLQVVPSARVLVAATHGLGIFYLKLP